MFEDEEEEEEEGCEEGHDDDVNVVTPDWLSKYLRPKIGPVKKCGPAKLPLMQQNLRLSRYLEL